MSLPYGVAGDSTPLLSAKSMESSSRSIPAYSPAIEALAIWTDSSRARAVFSAMSSLMVCPMILFETRMIGSEGRMATKTKASAILKRMLKKASERPDESWRRKEMMMKYTAAPPGPSSNRRKLRAASPWVSTDGKSPRPGPPKHEYADQKDDIVRPQSS